jgi:hypothetical protein
MIKDDSMFDSDLCCGQSAAYSEFRLAREFTDLAQAGRGQQEGSLVIRCSGWNDLPRIAERRRRHVS